LKKSTLWITVCAISLLCAATAIAAGAQTFTSLASFGGSNGTEPAASLVQGLDGYFYGTTYYGGTRFGSGYGAVFGITGGGELTLVYGFCAHKHCADGGESSAGLILGEGGNFYGTTRYGGAYLGGTVFRITPGGKLSTLYSFCAQPNCTDGALPFAGLVQASDGNFYGTTYSGGPNVFCGNPPVGCGTVFKMTSNGALTTLYNFCSQTDCADGASPHAGLIQATDGDLYGITASGGTYGEGSIFRINPAGKLTTLYSFCTQPGCTDGSIPFAGLIQASDGNFYGTTSQGGNLACFAPYGCGTVFKITPSGALTTLHAFGSQTADGVFPYAGLIQASDGNFYGTTYQGGANAQGAIFEITSGGTLTTLYSFCSVGDCDDGQWPFAGLVQASNGSFYGTAAVGGAYNDGTVFSLNMGLGPFVTFVRASGKVGQTGDILGQGFTGTTSVSLNGIPASFTVVSDTFIKATVPAGATTGYVTVTTPSGPLTSNVPFHVIP
jgi:uncharacterized repeat protein (TIGR03803 family)